MVKTCTKCGKEFDSTCFSNKGKIYKPKRKACYDCVPYRRPSTKSDGTRRCAICEEYKPTTEFHRHFGKYLKPYCKICTTNKARLERRNFKVKCIEYKGGKCQKCGYSRCPAALEFHHRNPDEKEFSLRDIPGVIRLTEKVKKELDKCDLYCSNCHKEKHFDSDLF